MTLRRPHAILLDIDNTVYAYEPCHRAGLSAAAQEAASLSVRWRDADAFAVDYKTARETVKKRIRETGAAHCRLLYFKEMIETEFKRSGIPEIRRLHDEYWAGYFSVMTPDDGCAALLREWREQGIKTAWVSDFTTERQMLKLLHLGLEDLVDYLITAEEVGAVKPHAGGIDLALAKLGVTASSTWFIGDDHERDLGAAHARGIASLWFQRVPDGKPSTEAEATVFSWAELTKLWNDVTAIR